MPDPVPLELRSQYFEPCRDSRCERQEEEEIRHLRKQLAEERAQRSTEQLRHEFDLFRRELQIMEWRVCYWLSMIFIASCTILAFLILLYK